MSNGPQAKATRDRKFFRKLARRENPIRFAVALPDDVKLEDIMWKPDRVEQLLNWLEEDRKQALADEMAYYRRKLKEHAEDIARDKAKGLIG